EKGKIPIKGALQSVTFGDSAILVTSQEKADFKTLTRIPLAGGESKSKEVAVAPTEYWTDPSTVSTLDDSMEGRVTLEKLRQELVGEGQDAVFMEVKLAKPNVLT